MPGTTTAVLGNERCFYMTDGKGTGTFTWVGGEQSNNLNRSADAIEVSDKKSHSWREFITGKRSATAAVTCNLDDTASAAQRRMLSAFGKGQKVFCFIGILSDEGDAPVSGTAFEAIITGCNDDNPQDAASTRSFDLQVSGEPIEYPVES
jgi:predicted secreted protein